MKQRFLLVLLLIPLLIFASCGKTSVDNSNMHNTASPVSVEQPDPEGSSTPLPEFSSAPSEPTATPVLTPAPATTPTPSSTPAPAQTDENSEKQQFNDTAIISDDGKTITVHNAYELLYHMASDKHFLLMPGDYNVYNTHFVEPYKPVLKSLENVIIEGVGNQQVEFLTSYIDCDVLYIENCKNITLKNLYLGHSPKVEYECEGSVLFLIRCQELTIESCTLFGCGAYGILGHEISNMLIQNSSFLDCEVNLAEIYDSKNIVIENSSFYNNEDESVEFERCRNIALRNCEFTGEFSPYPSLIFNGNDLIEYPSDGNTHVISFKEYSWGMLENVSVTGDKWFREASEKITALYEDLTVNFSKGTDQYHESTYIIFSVNYKESLPESEYLKQINEVLSIAGEYFKENIIIAVELDWPGDPDPDIYHSYGNKTIIHTAFNSFDSIMQDGRQYLSVDEARGLLFDWLPPVIDRIDMKPRYEENIEIKFINASIDGSDAYYLFEISNMDNIMFVLDVNAVNGSISDWFDGNDHAPVSHADIRHIQAVMDLLEEEGIDIADDVNWRAYIVNKNYLILVSSQGDSIGPFMLFEKEGKLWAEWYNDYSYD